MHTKTAWVCKTNIFWKKEVKGTTGIYDVVWAKTPPGSLVQYDYACTCKAFKYRHGYCKHIHEVKHDRCRWNLELSPDAEAKRVVGENGPQYVCPKCGEEAVPVTVSVE